MKCGQITLSKCSCDHCGATLKRCGVRGSAAVALLSLVMGCDGNLTPAVGVEYGAADTGYIDQDGDGYTPREGDCDDTNLAINPDATEVVGDGIDSNCDGDPDV
jgi:hypothetical protein